MNRPGFVVNSVAVIIAPRENPGDVSAGKAQVIKEPDDVLRHLFTMSCRVMRFATLPMATQVKRNHSMVLGEIRQHIGVDPCPFDRTGIALKQEDRLAGTLIDETDRNAQ